jgi:hypothetical protein
MTVAYDNDVSWPMSWYLRDYPGFFGDQPTVARSKMPGDCGQFQELAESGIVCGRVLPPV